MEKGLAVWKFVNLKPEEVSHQSWKSLTNDTTVVSAVSTDQDQQICRSEPKKASLQRFQVAIYSSLQDCQEGSRGVYRFWMILSKSVQQKATCASKASHFCRAKAVAHPTDLGLGVGQTKSPMKARSIEAASGNLSLNLKNRISIIKDDGIYNFTHKRLGGAPTRSMALCTRDYNHAGAS